jgi:hypothetical protein
MILTIVVFIISCKKEESYNNDSKGATIKNAELQFVAVKSSEATGSDFEYIELIGHSEINDPDYKYFAMSIYAPSIETKTYDIPEYVMGFKYENTSAYAVGYYSSSSSNAVSDWYSSQYIPGAGGSITISGISGSVIKGTYNLTLVNYKDATKQVKLTGDFEAKITSLNN